jgi:hypothetical protein
LKALQEHEGQPMRKLAKKRVLMAKKAVGIFFGTALGLGALLFVGNWLGKVIKAHFLSAGKNEKITINELLLSQKLLFKQVVAALVEREIIKPPVVNS